MAIIQGTPANPVQTIIRDLQPGVTTPSYGNALPQLRPANPLTMRRPQTAATNPGRLARSPLLPAAPLATAANRLTQPVEGTVVNTYPLRGLGTVIR